MNQRNSDYHAWKVLERVQRSKNFTDVRLALPGILTDPARKWLAHVLVLPTSERPKLEAALEGKITGWKEDVKALFSHPVIQRIAATGSIEDREIGLLELAQSCKTDLMVGQLRSVGVQNVDTWAKDLAGATGDEQAYRDYYTEGDYALAFARCRLHVTLKPTGKQGPDLKLVESHTEIYVEVSRFREDEILRQQMREAIGMGKLAEMPDKSQNVLDKLSSESQQLVDGQPGVVLLRSNNVGIDEREFQLAVEYKVTALAKMSAVIFQDTWLKAGDSAYPTCWGFMNAAATTQIRSGLLQRVGQCLDSNFRIVNDS